MTTSWAPTVADVGAQLRSRTKDTNGTELGTFTDATRPTGDEAQIQIDLAVADLNDLLKAGQVIPSTLYGSAKRVAVLDACLGIELSYWPEQVATGRSPYDQLKVLRDERLKSFVGALEDAGLNTSEDDGSGGGAGGDAAVPVGGFGPRMRIVGWRSGQW